MASMLPRNYISLGLEGVENMVACLHGDSGYNIVQSLGLELQPSQKSFKSNVLPMKLDSLHDIQACYPYTKEHLLKK